MQKPVGWRELLGYIIEKPGERERIATEMGIRSITLTRWVNGESNPRSQKLQALLKAFPEQYQKQLEELFEEAELSFLSLSEEENSPDEIPYKLIHEVLETRARSFDNLRFWTISNQVLQHALRHLDLESAGISISVVLCMPPTSDGLIHSLHESLGLGTAPWASSLKPKALFLGANSLSGYVITMSHFKQVEDMRVQTTFVPAYQTEHEVSAAACPIMYSNRVAGCLLFSSTRPKYFLSEARNFLIQGYTNLLALAFEPREFYPPEYINLSIMPSLEVQQPYLTGFRQRVVNIMKDAEKAQKPLTVTQAEQRAWQQIEEILLLHPSLLQDLGKDEQ